MTPTILFPSEIFAPKQTDPAFAEERAAAKSAGLSTQLIDQEHLDAGHFAKAVRSISAGGASEDESSLAIYRGWMLSEARYRGLYEALADQGVQLINSPEQYVHCHHLPESLHKIEARSPKSVWAPIDERATLIDRAAEAARDFGDKPVVIKDYVKSRKHEWEEACFVPAASDEAKLRAVISTFVERQDEFLTGGVVIREFIELEHVGTHEASGMPLTREHRIFVLDSQPLTIGRYWQAAEYTDSDVPFEEFEDIARSIESRFFTMDLALGRDGSWHIIELGDAQVAGLLGTIAASEFFSSLATRFDER